MLSSISSSPFLSSPSPPLKTLSGTSSTPPSSVRFRPSAVSQFALSTCLYEVLGIPVGASGDDIKAAYRRLARIFHPDVAVGSQGEDFVRINDAYSTLSDPERRADYDRKVFRRPRLYREAVVSSTEYYGYTTRNWETDQCW